MHSKHAPTDIDALRHDALQHLELGAVTTDYSADRKAVIERLNQALATELVCVLRYRRHHFMARGIHARSVAAEFLVHSNEEQGHADLLAARIVQLGGEPDFDPDTLTRRSHVQYIAGSSLRDMIREDLVAERVAIHSYRELVRYLGTDDPTTSDLIKTILAVEEQHANELADYLEDFPHSA
jgi:bacterioferritin